MQFPVRHTGLPHNCEHSSKSKGKYWLWTRTSFLFSFIAKSVSFQLEIPTRNPNLWVPLVSSKFEARNLWSLQNFQLRCLSGTLKIVWIHWIKRLQRNDCRHSSQLIWLIKLTCLAFPFLLVVRTYHILISSRKLYYLLIDYLFSNKLAISCVWLPSPLARCSELACSDGRSAAVCRGVLTARLDAWWEEPIKWRSRLAFLMRFV